MKINLRDLRLSRQGPAQRGVCLVGVIAASLVAAGCAMGPTYPPAPRAAAGADYDYVIGSLDTVNIIVWRNPELSLAVPVRPDGKITTPLVDDLPAQGKSPTALARDIEKALAKYIRDPVVTVVVTNFVGPSSEQIRVIGEATKPQILPYRQNMTILDVMIAVGGLTEFRRRQPRDDFTGGRRRKVVQRSPAGSGQARRHLGERRHAPGRHRGHSAKLVLAAAPRHRATAAVRRSEHNRAKSWMS